MGCCKSKDKVEQPKQTTVQRSENTEQADDIQVNRRVNIKSDFEANRERDRDREKKKKEKEKSPEKEKPSPKKKSKLPHQQQEEEEEEEHEEKPKKVAEMEVVRKVESEQAKNQRLKIAATNAKLISTTEERHENLQSLLMLLQETLEENSNEHGEIDDIVRALDEESQQTEDLLRVIETSKANVDKELLKSTTEFAQTVRQLKSEHTSYKQKKNDFRGFKRNILTFLNQQHPDLFMIEEEEDEHIDPNQAPNQSSNRTPSKNKIKSRSKLDQVISDKSMSLREKSITLVQKSLTSPRSNLMISPDKSILRSPERQTLEEVEPEIPKKVTPYDEAFDREMALYMEKERDDAVFALESAVNEYNRLVEDFNRMKEQKRTLKNEHMATQLEVRELKENNRDMSYNNEAIDMENGTYKGLQGDMLMGYNQVQESCKMLQNELEGMYRRQQQNQVDSQHINARYDEWSRALEQEIMEKHREAEELNKRYQENLNGFLTKENQIQQQRTLMHEQIDMQIEAKNLGYIPPIFSQNYTNQQIPVYNHTYEVEAPRKSVIYEHEIPINNGYDAGFDRTMKTSYPSGVEFYQNTLKKRYSPVRRVNEEEEENMNLQGVSTALDQSRQIRLSPKRVGEDLEAKRMEMQGSNYVGNHVGSRMSTLSGTYGSGSIEGNIGELNGYNQGNGYNSNLNGYSSGLQYNGQYESSHRFKGENNSQMDRRSNKYIVDVV